MKLNSIEMKKGLKKNDIYCIGILLIELALNAKVDLFKHKSSHQDT